MSIVLSVCVYFLMLVTVSAATAIVTAIALSALHVL